MDIMLNRWLLYQTLACRVWARSAFYQASGAYGFRDQLQDGMALALSRPAMTREHLLRAAARQFVEGDVQHWWLPPSGPGRAHAHLRRPRLARLRRRALRRARPATRAVLDERVPFLEGPALRRRRARRLLSARRVADESGIALRALRARARSQPRRRRARPAADRHRRLERRHEPGRRAGPRRERLARLVPVRDADGVRAARRRARRERRAPRAGWRTPRALRRLARTRRLGRRLVSARLLRRRHAARLGRERGVPHRLDRAVLERDLRGGGSGARRPRDGRRRRAADPSRRRSRAAVHAAVRPHVRSTRATSRAIRPACARTAASTLMPPRGRSWRSPRSARATRPRSCSRSSIRSTTPARAPTCSATRSSPTSWPPMSIRWRRTSGAAAGPGTRARPAGCTAPASSRSWACACRETFLRLDPCIPKSVAPL